MLACLPELEMGEGGQTEARDLWLGGKGINSGAEAPSGFRPSSPADLSSVPPSIPYVSTTIGPGPLDYLGRLGARVFDIFQGSETGLNSC